MYYFQRIVENNFVVCNKIMNNFIDFLVGGLVTCQVLRDGSFQLMLMMKLAKLNLLLIMIL